MEAMTLFSVLIVSRAVESSSDTRTRAPLLTVRPANLQGNNNKWVSFTKPLCLTVLCTDTAIAMAAIHYKLCALSYRGKFR